jgi:hypothetical protein
MNPTNARQWLSWTTSRGLVYFTVASFLFFAALGVLFSQSPTGGQEQGRLSKPGELQTGQKPEDAALPTLKMEPEKPLRETLVMGKVERMEEHLARGPIVVEGKKQEPVISERAMAPYQGKGQQERKQGAEPSLESNVSHLRLVLRLTDGGPAEVISATEIPGPATLSDIPTGDYLSEVLKGGEPVAVQALPDPFEIHSFNGPPGTPQEKHHFERVKTATVLVDVPEAGIATNLEGYAVRFYKIKPGPNLERVNPAAIQKLQQEQRLDLQIEVPGSRLAPEVRLKGKKLIQ